MIEPGAAGEGAYLEPREMAAVGVLVSLVRGRVNAHLEQALLFGSRARRQARPDSDVDVLLVFRRLTRDREPHAGQAERLAARVAARSGVPLGVWCVSREDLREGQRTPMLVDALADAVPLWLNGCGLRRVGFTPRDALFCAGRLLDRVQEGSEEVAALRARGRPEWPRRVRDDLVRLCTAAVLLAGETRPRRSDAVRRCLELDPTFPLTAGERRVLAWAARSYPRRHLELDDPTPVPPPPAEFAMVARLLDRLRARVVRRGRRVRRAGTFVRGEG